MVDTHEEKLYMEQLKQKNRIEFLAEEHKLKMIRLENLAKEHEYKMIRLEKMLEIAKAGGTNGQSTA